MPLTPSASVDLDLMRAAVLLESDPAAAASHASDILASWPAHEEASLLLAAACRRLGDPATAIELLQRLAGAHPASSVMQLELGRAQAANGQQTQALAAFQRATELEPTLADAWRELAEQRFQTDDEPGGDAAYAQYSRLAVDPPELTDATVALWEDRWEAAEKILQRRLRHTPRDVAALRMLADVSARRGDRESAERILKECLLMAHGFAGARYDLARLLYSQQRVEEALPLIERLLATAPDDSNFLTLKAQAIRFMGRSDESIALMEAIVASRPLDAQAWLLFGNFLREVGEPSRAIDAYRSALAVQPEFAEAYSSLANMKTARFSEADIEAMRGLLERSPALGYGRTHLEFALGKALEDAEQFAMSFEHYSRGNARQRASIDYDPSVTTAELLRAKSLYEPSFFAERSGWGSVRPDPIFIVGMPRSGSTLLEQILASHSQVEGTRELPDLPAMAQELLVRVNAGAPAQYPQELASLSKDAIEVMAARYLAQTQTQRPLQRARFVDKMLSNFCHVGLIQLMFPHASIIDARRHPLGCSFSCFKQLFARGVHFSYDLGELGSYYRDYAELMEHMDGVLPGRVHRVHYEQLVADPEREVRRLLDYCGLAFEQQCLRFYDTRRVVQTISSEQVRRPIYTEAIEHWRHYEPWLGPLKERLGDILPKYPA